MPEPMLPSERLKEYGWFTGTLKSETGERCLMGALVPDPVDAYGGEMSYEEVMDNALSAYGDRLASLVHSTGSEFLAQSSYLTRTPQGDRALYRWNDSVCETASQAIEMLESVGL